MIKAKTTRRRRPKILVCTPEITELPEGMGNAANFVRAKGGGLGDISAALIEHFFNHDDFEVHIAMPKYDTRIREQANISQAQLDQLAKRLGKRGIHLVSDSAFSQLDEVYGPS